MEGDFKSGSICFDLYALASFLNFWGGERGVKLELSSLSTKIQISI